MPKKDRPQKPPRFVDYRAVKAAVSMEQVLAHYGLLASLTKSHNGDSLSGPCPLHQGSNPTQFRVSVSKNCWNCFSECKCGGNVLDFVAKKENVEPLEAAHRLIEWFKLDAAAMTQSTGFQPRETRYGVPVESHKDSAPKTPSRQSPSSTLPPPASQESEEVGINPPLKFTLKLDSSHDYLAERGLTPETVKEFGVGFCAKGVMAGRIAFPIHDVQGNAVGYAGRWPGEPPEGRPKYRLPDGFKKSVEVYRLGQALHESLEHPLIIVEGFFDVMKLWQLGVRKCVALMGCSMSEAQESLLAQHLKSTSQVIVMFDEDDAGRGGRDDVLRRLARFAFVRLIAFSQEGFQPEHLSNEQLNKLGLLAE